MSYYLYGTFRRFPGSGASLCRILLLVWMGLGAMAMAQDDDDMAGFDEDEATISIHDPLEKFVNRPIYHFNDKLYFWVLKPLATGYKMILPKVARKGIGNAFTNLGMPKRAVNGFLQGKFAESGREVSRFIINSTIGLLGVWDPAKLWWDIEPGAEDFGQTLGHYGVGSGIYLTLPFWGPSNPRDTIGLVVDGFLDPINYVAGSTAAAAGIHGGDRVNHTSMHLGEYEKAKETSLDYYVTLRESYTQHRKELIRR